MALFSYQAISNSGKKLSGVIDADSYMQAKEKLLKAQVMITALEAVEAKKQESFLPPSLLLGFTRELAQLLRSGLPLYESCLTIEEKYRGQKSHPLFLDLCDHLKGGHPLSSAFKKYPKTFDPIYLSMVQAGEETASLATIFEQLSVLIARQMQLKKKLTSALIYPAFLGSFCFALILGLLFFVIPSMQELFEDRQLHPMTQIVLSVSRCANEHVSLFFGSIVAIVFLVIALAKNKQAKLLLEKNLFNIPFVKTVVMQSALVRFSRAAGLLLEGGVPLVQTLELSRSSMKNALLESVIKQAEAKLAEGEKLSRELKKSPLVPNLVIRMLATAEETGKLAPMFHHISDIYNEELEKNLEELTTYLQPALLLFIGAIVAVVLLSLLLPLTDVSSFISQ